MTELRNNGNTPGVHHPHHAHHAHRAHPATPPATATPASPFSGPGVSADQANLPNTWGAAAGTVPGTGGLAAFDANNPDPFRRSTPALMRTGTADTGTNTDVANLQRHLSQLRDNCGQPYLPASAASGHYDAATADAVKRFQTEHNLRHHDGIVGPETEGALNRVAGEQHAFAALTGGSTPGAVTPTADLPAVNNSEALTQMPAAGAAGDQQLDRASVEQRRALLKGLEGGWTTSAEEDAAKGRIAASLLRTNPEALTPEDAAVLHRGSRELVQEASVAQLARMRPETRLAMMNDAMRGLTSEADRTAFGRLAAAHVLSAQDPAKAAQEIQDQAFMKNRPEGNAETIRAMSDADLQRLASTPGGQQALHALYDHANNAVFSNNETQTAQRARLFQYLR